MDVAKTDARSSAVVKAGVRGVKLSQTKAVVQSNKVLLLADISGSMAGEKLEGLKRALRDIWKPGFECVGFGSDLYEITEQDIDRLTTAGNTAMLAALEYAWQPGAPSHAVLLSDGMPTDATPNTILEEVRKHPYCKVDTVGFFQDGYDRAEAERLLKSIAEATGGRYMHVSEPLKLSAAVQVLIDAPKASFNEAIRL